MTYLTRTLLLLLSILLGGLLYAVTINILVSIDIFSATQIDSNIGYMMTQKAVYVWLVSIVIGLPSIFIKSKWRNLLAAIPLLSPSVFAILYTLFA